jgi:hypothetical protein
MKKRGKKLSLHRETVRNLDESRLQGVAGGGTYDEGQCRTSCRCLDHPDTFSSDCTAHCPLTSMA